MSSDSPIAEKDTISKITEKKKRVERSSSFRWWQSHVQPIHKVFFGFTIKIKVSVNNERTMYIENGVQLFEYFGSITDLVSFIWQALLVSHVG